jgi:hypothetical protein
MKRLKGFLLEAWPFILLFVFLCYMGYNVYEHANSPAGIEWLTKPITSATMEDTLGIGGILVVVHAIMSRGD